MTDAETLTLERRVAQLEDQILSLSTHLDRTMNILAAVVELLTDDGK